MKIAELNKEKMVEECLWGRLYKIEKLTTKEGYRVSIDILYPVSPENEQQLKHELRSKGIMTRYKK